MSWFKEIGLDENEEYVGIELREKEIIITKLKKEPSN